MTDLKNLLKDQRIETAVVIDDVFDEIPKIDELDDGDWSIFFADIEDQGKQLLSQLHAGYDNEPADKLKSDPEFVAILWNNRNDVQLTATKNLFQEYEQSNYAERRKLENLIKRLEGLGLTCEALGRDSINEAKKADLIFIDLYLGYQQSEEDMERAIRFIRELLADRTKEPPLAVLTSSSSLLYEKRNEFRDEAGLLESMFRVARKAELDEEGRLEKILTRLAANYEDAKKVAGFVDAWKKGLDRASENFIKIVRGLDLPDFGKMQAQLLVFEGQKLGEYVLEVTDRVLQHEIEGDNDTIAAALRLNEIDLEKYPGSHLSDTTDSQEIVHRMVFLHPNRLQISRNEGKPQLQFGDILRWKENENDIIGNEVSLVVNPACDLVRRGAERVLLLSGDLEDLQPTSWSYRPNITAVVILPEEGRKQIRWNVKNVKSLSWNELDELLLNRRLELVGRLRETYAIQIQQLLLADLGRIGSLANLPAPFPVAVSVFYVGLDGNARALDTEDLELGACYVGRGEESRVVYRLVLKEQDSDRIENALRRLDDSHVHESAIESLKALKADPGFFLRFQRGEIEMSRQKGKKPIQVDGNTYAGIFRGEEFEEGNQIEPNFRKAALIVKVTDIPENDVD